MSQITIDNKTFAVKSGGQIRFKGIVRTYTEQEIAENKGGIADYIVTLPTQQFLVEVNSKPEKPKK